MGANNEVGSQESWHASNVHEELPPLACSPQETSLNDLLHDLRSPLSVITTWVEILRDANLQDSQRREGLEIISLSVQEMTRLLNRWSGPLDRGGDATPRPRD